MSSNAVRHRSNPASFAAGQIATVSLEFFPKRVLAPIMLNPHPCAGEIKRRPEVETLLATRDNHTEVMKKVLNWLMEGVN